jgi:hypothetical protein
MSLIINQFEIVVETQNEETQGAFEPVRSQSQPQLTPLNVHTIIMYQTQRMNRIRAH